MLRRFWKDEQGLEPVEYALMLVLLALVAVGGAMALGTVVSTKFAEVGGEIQGQTPTIPVVTIPE